MKKILIALALVLTGFELRAQTPPTFPAPAQRTIPRYDSMTAPGQTAASRTAVPGQDEIAPIINWQGVDLNQVLEIYAQYVGRTLLRANLPAAQIVLKTQTPLTRAETIQAIQAVLALNGISVINVGDKFVKVLPSDQANTAGAELDETTRTNLPNLGSFVTHIAQLKFVRPTEMVQVLQQFAKLPNSILAIDSNGILVIRDYAENVKRMLEMIDRIDVSVPAEYISEVIPIRYAKVDDIANALNSLGGGGGGGATVSIGSSVGAAPISGFGGRSGGLGGSSGGGLGGSSAGGYQSGINGTASPFGNRTGLGAGGAANPNGTPTPGGTFADRLNRIINRAGGPSGGGGGQDQIQLFGQTKIIPNESSSSLLVFATRQDMVAITNIIAKLDVPLAQVLIEAVIMDVNLGHKFNFGVSAAQNPTALSPGGNVVGGGGFNNGNPFLQFMRTFTTNFSTITGVTGVSSVASSFTTAGATNSIFGNNLGGGASYFANIGPTWDVAVSAAQSDNNASIIQRPRIQTSQAKAAQFFVGSTVPYVTGNSYGGAYGNQSSYSQLSVGVELDVTPFINPDGLVVMDIQQEIDDLNGSTHIDNVGDVPNTIKRTLNAEIAVRDRDTVMMGGFIKSDKSHTQSGVPFLSSIPILGNLFKQRADQKDREELIVLMRPTVLQTPEIAAKQTIKEQQRLPGVSAAAAEDAEYERKLIEDERKREKKRFNKTKEYDGFFNTAPDVAPTNTVTPPSVIMENNETNVGPGAVTEPDNSINTQDRSRAALEEKLREMDSTNTPR